MKRKAIVLLSGGIDSTVCLCMAVKRWGCENVTALGFDYGQKHSVELSHARQIAEHYHVKFETINVSDVFGTNNSKLIGGHSKGTYEVPFRNIVLVSIAANYARNRFTKSNVLIYLGITKEDDSYSDCSANTINCMQQLLKSANNVGNLDLVTPLAYSCKAEVVDYGIKNAVPFELTYTCYEGGSEACGKCPACLIRKKAFEAVNSKDPIIYVNDVEA